ncbi:MAG TPA: ABC transporter ATP-binding protein [Terriglobia bacterium]|jgi:ABC-2 type transport system ATP-binding protein
MMESMMKLKAVSKSFDGRNVLNHIDLEIPRGRVVGLLGKNGAGKTTLLKCALGLLKTNTGTAKLFGEDVWNLSGPTKARIGYVPQKAELYPWMKVRQMMNYIAAFYPTWNTPLSTSLLSRWELDPDDNIGTLSEGQRQKLSLLLAMGYEPDLLILDEPAASLDPQARRTFLSTVIDIATKGSRTIVFSTHITSDLERVASDIVLLKGGTVNYSGSMDDLKDSVKSLRLTGRGRLPETFDVPGVLSVRTEDRDALLTVRGVDDHLIHQLEKTYSATVEVRDLNLEDIFVEVHRD